eukprot:3903992-Rhodomonas_salina.2
MQPPSHATLTACFSTDRQTHRQEVLGYQEALQALVARGVLRLAIPAHTHESVPHTHESGVAHT